jgi:pimeloyl-ACP methyl ester carboxylesterase
MRTARWLVLGSFLCVWGAVEEPRASAARSIHSSVLVERTMFGKALRGNRFAETLNRKILVYLPPGYHAPANRHRRYPVVYLLAGLGGDHKNFAADGTPNRIAAGRPQMIDLGLDMQKIADQLITNNAIDEAILVGVSGMNTLSNHWFACSEVIGDYRSHVASDIVRYVDRNFRTRRDRNHRALLGHSSGAFGALSLAIEYPHKFGAVGLLGPAGNDFAAAVPPSTLPRLIQLFLLANPTTIGDPLLMPVDGSPIPDGPFWALWGSTPTGGRFINNAIFSLAGAYSPNPNNPLFLVDLPVMYPGKVIVQPVLDLWLDDDLVSQVSEAAGNLAGTPVYLHRGIGPTVLHPEVGDIPLLRNAFINSGVQHTFEELPGDHFTSLPQALANSLTFVLNHLGTQVGAIVYDDTQRRKHIACRQALRNNWDDDEDDDFGSE